LTTWHYGPLENRPTGGRLSARASREELRDRLHPFRADMRVGGQMQQIAIVPTDDAVGRAAQPHRFAGDGIERWLDIGR
jgi:hypothetical protein